MADGNRYKLVENLSEAQKRKFQEIFGNELERVYIICCLTKKEFEQIKGGLK